ncbi:DUF4914 family protein [Anaerolinea thermophila]|uniref:DUF4914 domain-containing protein n=1 Tax=Anaerolinea thermophila (strain DSM 14523 / JCM 11388 / NBRC 100420 / UNI-1) TaxID=926569 RepID=E8MYH8_ANATU|nr:DUF4914 family protein [Anaerolinea thermophila]BAJ62123.1 hypothetical protein ANT_00890 [Anaerolinea thermophila UNI-1]
MDWTQLGIPEEAKAILKAAPRVISPASEQELVDLACGGRESKFFEVAYEVPGVGRVVEATVARVRNGVAANYPEPYMRRRDPNCLVVGDDLPTDKPRFAERFGEPFEGLRQQTFDWLKSQELIVFAFNAGADEIGLGALVLCPANAGFFALGLAMLQGMLNPAAIPADFHPAAVVYVAPVFRHTHFQGKQVVVHNRLPHVYEMFSYNLYPGPSAKKGVYGMLLSLGEKEGWTTAHCSTVRVITPYDNEITIMHEGASGGGKSEMLEQAHRAPDGRWLLGRNLVTGEERYLQIPRACELRPVTDDMALCHPSIQANHGKLRLKDAERSWFVRVDHIRRYGTDPFLEGLTAQPERPLLFLNIDAVPGARALIWEHIEDAPGKPCPNPRVIIPRAIVPNIIENSVTVDIRSFGVRTPPCTREKPSYGIIGLFHILPPALAWLWRLVAPRGYDNPSIVETEGMSSEGVGSYWPFASGLQVRHANILLDQFAAYRRMRYILVPNQHIGAWKVGFMAEWIAREYLARRGSARFRPEQIRPARCALLGYAMHQMQVEGQQIARWFLQVDTQPEVGEEGYDQGAQMLYEFFQRTLQPFLTEDLDPLGRQIITCALDRGTLQDFEALIPAE